MSDETAFDDEDITADIWATAEAMVAESEAHPGIWSVKESIARAIAIERQRERERSAAIAKREGKASADMYPVGEVRGACFALADTIETAIRRGTPHA